jgi:1,4-alpha-glucan branching enzyme
MGCCGQKRTQWAETANNREKEPVRQEKKDQDAVVRNNPEFEYTGLYSLTVTGAATGKKYHFRFKGDRLTVDYYDSFAMRAEQNLKTV